MLSDLRFAFRQLLRAPAFTTIALLTLALGIGLNAALFSFLNGTFLRPLPFPNSSRLYRVYRTTPQQASAPHSNANYLDFVRTAPASIQLGAFRMWSFTLAEPGRPARMLDALRVSASYLRVLGLPPELGRWLRDEDDRADASPVVILSHRIWEQEFGSDPNVIGRDIRVDGRPTTVVGVMPASFDSLVLWGPSDVICPLRLTAEDRKRRTDPALNIVARLAPDVSRAQAEAQLRALAAQLAKGYPKENAESSVRLHPLHASGIFGLVDTFRQLSWFTLALAGTVLWIACANLANLQLSRVLRQTREYAVRSALGASQLRLMRPMLCECLLLSIAGGTLALLVVQWTNDWLGGSFRQFGLDVRPDWRVFLFALAVSTATGLLFGVAPAWIVSRLHMSELLKSGARGATGSRSQSRFRGVLIAGQFSFAVLLLAGAGLMHQGAAQLLARDHGWQTKNLLMGIVQLPSGRYPDDARVYDFYRRLEQSAAALPGVEQVGTGWALPIIEYLQTRAVIVEGGTLPAAGHEPIAYTNGVTPTLLSTLGIKLVSGRGIAATDDAKAPAVVLINESMARTFFPGVNPLGHRIRAVDAEKGTWMEIVGVVGDVGFAASVGAPATRFQMYRPLAQDTWTYVTVALRTSVPPATLAEGFRQTVAALDPDLPVQRLSPVADSIERAVGTFMRGGVVLAGLAGLGLFLATIGIYGVISYQVVQRTPEIGVRIALGAPTRSVLNLVIGSGLRLALLGIAIGLLGAVGVGVVLHRVSPVMPAHDVPTTVEIAGLLIAVAFVASFVPARRATKVDPITALRAE